MTLNNAERVIEVENFHKTFRVGFRRKLSHAARGISFHVEQGEIFGFLGPNGSGKTTTIKTLLSLIRPDSGTLRIMGVSPQSASWRRQVGYMPESPNFYEYLTALEMVTWFASLSGLARHEAEQTAKRQLERVGLSESIRRPLRGYSKGMLQRAGLAQALVGAPKLLILDEPMTGLDPIGRKELRDLLLELRTEGTTIFYSTHILPDVEMTCDRVSILERGQTRKTGRLQDILKETSRGVTVVLSARQPEAQAYVHAHYPEVHFADGINEFRFANETLANQFLLKVLPLGAELVRFDTHRDNLEEIFLRSLSATETAAVGAR